MYVDEYLNNVLSSKAASNQYTKNEEAAYISVCSVVNEWAQQFNSINNYYYGSQIYINTEKSGSKSKNDAIKGKSDVDLFVSISDKNNKYTTKDYYNSLYDFLKDKYGTEKVRKQNVSIGLQYAGVSIDLTPGKRINTNSIWNYDDHNIYQRKSDSVTKTNINKQRNYVVNSGCLDVIRLMKIWRDCHNLDIPSIALEIITVETLKGQYINGLYNRFKKVLEKIAKDFATMRIIDPGNPYNNIADSISNAEKEKAKNKASYCLNFDYGDTVVTKSIIW